jgi:hemolysin activation/secretion protein
MKKYFISATVVVAAVAANLPNSSTILRQVQPLKELHVEEKPLVEVGGVEKYTPIMQDDTNGKKIFVKAFKLTHVMNVSETQLQEALKPYIGKELSFSELQEAASVITKFYRSKGYFVVRAYIPKQKIENNIVEIAVIEGYYGKFKIDNNSTFAHRFQ